MSRDDGGGSYPDLTPGDFHVAQPTEVDTTSLGAFGRTYAMDTEIFFGGNSQALLGLMLGEPGIGNTTAFHELGGINHLSTLGAEKADRNATDLRYGNLALGNAAMYMAEQYASTDAFSGAITAGLVSDVFQPTGEGHTLLQDRLQAEQAEAEARAEAAQIHPADRHFYNLLGIPPPSAPAPVTTSAPADSADQPPHGQAPEEPSPLEEFLEPPEAPELESGDDVPTMDLVEPAVPAAPGPDGVIADAGDWAEDNLTIDPRQMRP